MLDSGSSAGSVKHLAIGIQPIGPLADDAIDRNLNGRRPLDRLF